jgi:Tol biopolymer transport system component
MLVYRSTLTGDVVAEAVDRSQRRILELNLDPTAETLADLSCAPDGKAAAYAVANGVTGMSTISIVGAGQTSGLPLPARVSGMAWSPDGQRIALTAFDARGVSGYSLMLLDVASGAITTAATGEGLVGPPRWSPDGTTLLFDIGNPGPNQVCMLRVGDANPARITNRQLGAFNPEWKPDGNALLFSGPGPDNISQIYSLPLSGGTEAPLTSSLISKTVPRYSPDGSKLAFVGVVSIPVVSAMAARAHNLGVWVAGADGTGEEMFTDLSQDAWLMGWCLAVW